MKKKSWILELFWGVPRGVWILMALYIVVMVGLSVFQYNNFLYAGYDLAIFDQVVWNLSEGRWFEYTFNPYSYLVDHRAWLLAPVALLYKVAAHPITLLVLQSIVIASGVVPFVLIVRQVLGERVKHIDRLSVVAALLYLFQPSLQSMNLFEFHMLPLVVPLALWLWWALIGSRWWCAVIVFVLLLFVREDTALGMIGLGVLFVLFSKVIPSARARWIGVGMALASAVWFGFMVWVGALFSPEGSSKFFTFYGWLGDTPGEGLATLFTSPLQTLSVLFGHDHLIVILFLLAAVAFLPLLRLRYLLPALPPLLLYLLIDQHMLSPVLKSHYAAVLVPWLLIAAVYGYDAMLSSKRAWRSGGAAGAVVVAIIFSQWLMIGPQWTIAHRAALMEYRDLSTYVMSSGNDFGEQTPEHVMMSERLYSHSGRQQYVYPTLHVFTGKQHFSDVDYTPPEQVDYIFLEQESILRYGINLPFEDRADAYQRLAAILATNDLVVGDYTEDILSFIPRNELVGDPKLPVSSFGEVAFPLDVVVNDDLRLLGWDSSVDVRDREYDGREQGALRLRMQKQHGSPFEDDQHIEVVWRNISGEVLKRKLMALGVGIQPSHMWEPGLPQVVRLPLEHPIGAASLELNIGPLEKQFGPQFTLWRTDPILDPGRTVTVPLPEIILPASP